VPDRLALALVALLLAPLAAPAAGLGRLTPLSLLGDPLNAEIEIVSLLPGEGGSLAVNIAPEEAYRQGRVTPAPGRETLRAAVERKADGGYVVRVSSTEPIARPLVDLLIELSWAGGRVVRQYSFSLDAVEQRAPPVATAPVAVEAPRAPAVPLKPAVPERAPDASKAPARAPAKAAVPERAPDASKARAPAGPATGGTYEVQRGDTLFKVARTTRHEGVALVQMVVAIYRANENAFVAANMSHLTVGRTLTIPDRDAVAAIKPEEARRVFAARRAAPDEARRGPGAAAPAGPEGDDAIALDRALAEARDRTAKLEQTLAGLRQLIEARDREIAEVQRQLAGTGPGQKAGPGQPPRKAAR